MGGGLAFKTFEGGETHIYIYFFSKLKGSGKPTNHYFGDFFYRLKISQDSL